MKPAGPTSQSFISQRLRLHYAEWGDPEAPVLILQHGGRDHCRNWDWVAQEFAADWRIVAPDLRGHGDSAWSPDGSYTMDGFVYDFAQLVHTLGAEQVTIVAHSLGGNIATRFTALYPEKVRRLVNIEGLGPNPEMQKAIDARPIGDKLRQWIDDKRKAAGRIPRRYPTLEAAYARMKEENAFLTDERARHLTIHGTSRNEDGTWSWKFDNYLNIWSVTDIAMSDRIALWNAIECPVLLLYGLKSFATSPRLDGRLAHFRDARVIEYEEAGHWLHHDQFERFVADVLGFI
jgi:pimeloyl-ACP methyl ester carboxylesterase